MQPIDMRVDNIELVRASGNRFQQRCLDNHRVRPWAAEAKSLRPNGMQLGGGLGIPAGEKRYLMSQAYQFIDQPRHHSLGAAVELGRNAFGYGRYLGNSHRLSTISGLSSLKLQITSRVRPYGSRLQHCGLLGLQSSENCQGTKSFSDLRGRLFHWQ